MNVLYSRRRLCRLVASVPLVLPLYKLSAMEHESGQQDCIYISNEFAEPVIRKGSVVLVDTGTKLFNGDGIYVYPDWGNPVAYEVTQDSKGNLVFTYPGKKMALWQMNPQHPDAVFSGKAIGYLAPEEIKQAEQAFSMRELQFPVLPA